MSVTISVRFPHGRYHATGWDSAANSGDVEWPPSPWRLARALLSVWHTRLPDIAPEVIGQVLDVLRDPPTYWLPPVSAEHTRHYLPQRGHRGGDKPDTTMTLDACVHVDPAQRVVISWPGREVSPPVREALASLLVGLPYLGRAESVCEAQLLPVGAQFDELDEAGWCGPDAAGSHRVLCLAEDTTRADLEVRPDDMRAAKRRFPQGSRWVAYPRPLRAPDNRRAREHESGQESGIVGRPTGVGGSTALVEVLRWRLTAGAPFLAKNGLLATEGLRAPRVRRAGDTDPRIHGHRHRDEQGRPLTFDPHRGAHWLWLEGEDRAEFRAFHWIPEVAQGGGSVPPRRLVRDVALWVPDGIDPGQLPSLLSGGLLDPDGYSPAGYVPSPLHLVAIGSAKDALPEMTSRGSTEWVSATPFLSVRHRRKNESFEEFLEDDVRREWARRQTEDDGPRIVEVESVDAEFDPWANGRRGWTADYRQKRWLVPRRTARSRGSLDPTYDAMVRIRLDRPVTGPVSLGGSCHFGFGLFMPIGRT